MVQAGLPDAVRGEYFERALKDALGSPELAKDANSAGVAHDELADAVRGRSEEAWSAVAEEEAHFAEVRTEREAPRLSVKGSWGRTTERVQRVEDVLLAALVQRGVLPLLREELNKRLARAEEDLVLRVESAEGLAEGAETGAETRTAVYAEVERLMEQMKLGSIGVAGPRGAGKSTLIRAFCTARTIGGLPSVSVMVSAPVDYEPRDFVLHLFEQLCLEVRGPFRREIPPWLKRPRWQGVMRLGLAVQAAGVVLILASAVDWRHRVHSWSGGIFLVVAGMALLLAYAVANWWRAARPVAHLGPGIEGLDDAIRARAESLLREIKFQQSFTQGWSGSIKLPAGFEVGSQESTTLAERQQSFPEIVDRLRRFIVEITATHRVVIGIDEMDKIASNEDAQRFLNDIKGIFGIPHCFYLVSISEDAMSSFERRGLPFRDAFDSSFDEVVHVTFFTLEDTKRFLEGRIVGLGLAFASLCHCVAGGLARDVIRVARDIAAHAQAPEPERRIDTVCRSLVRAELAGKCDAVTLSARSLAVEPALSDFVRWAKGLHALRLDAEPLLEHCGRYPESLRRGGPEPDSSEARDRAKLRSLATELVGFAYFAATLLDFFDDSLDRSKLEECRRGDDEQKRLDALAEARQLFAINASVAWERVSAFRRAWGVRTVEFPPQPPVPAAAHDGAGAELDAGVSSRP